MSARDLFHNIVKNALEKAGWQITHDPYGLQTDSFALAIDLGAEKIIAAEQGENEIDQENIAQWIPLPNTVNRFKTY